MGAGDVARNFREESGGSRAALLDAASALMAERDTLKVPISDIAARAGVNSALIKYYFGSKSGMLRALLERDLSDAVRELQALMKADMRPSLKMRYHLSGLIPLVFPLSIPSAPSHRDDARRVARDRPGRSPTPTCDPSPTPTSA